jgi:hypothetical protein
MRPETVGALSALAQCSLNQDFAKIGPALSENRGRLLALLRDLDAMGQAVDVQVISAVSATLERYLDYKNALVSIPARAAAADDTAVTSPALATPGCHLLFKEIKSTWLKHKGILLRLLASAKASGLTDDVGVIAGVLATWDSYLLYEDHQMVQSLTIDPNIFAREIPVPTESDFERSFVQGYSPGRSSLINPPQITVDIKRGYYLVQFNFSSCSARLIVSAREGKDFYQWEVRGANNEVLRLIPIAFADDFNNFSQYFADLLAGIKQLFPETVVDDNLVRYCTEVIFSQGGILRLPGNYLNFLINSLLPSLDERNEVAPLVGFYNQYQKFDYLDLSNPTQILAYSRGDGINVSLTRIAAAPDIRVAPYHKDADLKIYQDQMSAAFAATVAVTINQIEVKFSATDFPLSARDKVDFVWDKMAEKAQELIQGEHTLDRSNIMAMLVWLEKDLLARGYTQLRAERLVKEAAAQWLELFFKGEQALLREAIKRKKRKTDGASLFEKIEPGDDLACKLKKFGRLTSEEKGQVMLQIQEKQPIDRRLIAEALRQDAFHFSANDILILIKMADFRPDELSAILEVAQNQTMLNGDPNRLLDLAVYCQFKYGAKGIIESVGSLDATLTAYKLEAPDVTAQLSYFSAKPTEALALIAQLAQQGCRFAAFFSQLLQDPGHVKYLLALPGINEHLTKIYSIDMLSNPAILRIFLNSASDEQLAAQKGRIIAEIRKLKLPQNIIFVNALKSLPVKNFDKILTADVKKEIYQPMAARFNEEVLCLTGNSHLFSSALIAILSDYSSKVKNPVQDLLTNYSQDGAGNSLQALLSIALDYGMVLSQPSQWQCFLKMADERIKARKSGYASTVDEITKDLKATLLSMTQLSLLQRLSTPDVRLSAEQLFDCMKSAHRDEIMKALHSSVNQKILCANPNVLASFYIHFNFESLGPSFLEEMNPLFNKISAPFKQALTKADEKMRAAVRVFSPTAEEAEEGLIRLFQEQREHPNDPFLKYFFQELFLSRHEVARMIQYNRLDIDKMLALLAQDVVSSTPRVIEEMKTALVRAVDALPSDCPRRQAFKGNGCYQELEKEISPSAAAAVAPLIPASEVLHTLPLMRSSPTAAAHTAELLARVGTLWSSPPAAAEPAAAAPSVAKTTELTS